jgi:hypothetical protein
MNEQPGQLISFLALMVFLAITLYHAIVASKKPIRNKKSNDWMIPIGYVYEHKEPTAIRVLEVAKVAKVPKVAKVINTPVIEKVQKSTIFDDCLLALIATGYKKNDAKKITEQIFKSNNPKTVEDFIRVAFKK